MSRFRQQFEYYLNVIYYAMYNITVHRNRIFQYISNRACIYAVCLLFKGQRRRKYIRHFISIQKDANVLFFNRENGLISHSAKKFFLNVPQFYGVTSFGIIRAICDVIGYYPKYKYLYVLSLVIIPFGLAFLFSKVVEDAVFTKNQYLDYAKIFETKDKAWHFKSVILAILYVVGLVIPLIIIALIIIIHLRFQKNLP